MAIQSDQPPFWLPRYYDFNVFTQKKRIEKLRYMHRNPVKRGLVTDPMLTAQQLQSNLPEKELFDILSNEANRLIPADVQSNPDALYAAVTTVPPGIRALAGMHAFDVSMTLDDVAWHFGNHPDERHIQEVLWSLRELNAPEVYSLFEQAVAIVRPHLEVLRTGTIPGDDFREWLEDTGIQTLADPLNTRLREIQKSLGYLGFLQLVVNHARSQPERFLVAIQ